MALKQALVRILKDRANRIPEGAGVLVGKRKVLTCAHVVAFAVPNSEKNPDSEKKPVYIDFPLLKGGGSFKARIQKIVPPMKKNEHGSPEDICILDIDPSETLPEDSRPAAFLAPHDDDFFDREVRMCGFPKPADPEGEFRWENEGEYADGELKGPTVRGWIQLDTALTSRAVAPGYSGTPVWDKRTGKAAGIIVSRSGRDNKIVAYMIPVVQFADLVPETSDPRTGKRPGALRECLAWKCNRQVEKAKFIQYLRQSKNIKIHHLVFVPGDGNARHVSLARRLAHSVEVSRTLRNILGREVIPCFEQVPWPAGHGRDIGLEQLRVDLFRKLKLDEDNYVDETGPEIFMDLCRRVDLKKHGAVILAHQIPSSQFRLSADILHDYVKRFWGRIPCSRDLPIFFLFFNVVLPQVAHPIAWIRCCRIKGHLRKMSTIALREPPERFQGICFDPLKPVTRVNVDNWFIRYYARDLPSKKEAGIARLFKDNDKIPMVEVEHFLEEIIETYNHEQAGL
jgi:hypothetical protein